MSRAENRHHRQRVIKKRIKEIKITWPSSCSICGPEWIIKQARQKDNPFTRCSCEMCTNKMRERAENKKERKLAKQVIKEED